MKFSTILFVSLLLAFISCKNKDAVHLDPQKVFDIKDTLKAEILPTPLITGDNTILYDMDSLYLCYTRLDNYFLQLLDYHSSELIYHTGRIGRGPGELGYPYPAGFDIESGTVYVADMHTHAIIPFQVKDSVILQSNSFQNNRHTFLPKSFQKISDSTYVILNTMINQSIKTIDLNGHVYDSIRNAPIKIGEGAFFDRGGFTTTINITPDKSRLIATDTWIPKIRIYSLEENQLLLRSEKEYFETSYEIIGGNFYPNRDQQSATAWSYVSSHYFFILNFGVKYGETRDRDFLTKYKNSYVMVFKMNGEYVKTLLFDHPFLAFTVSQDEKRLSAPVWIGEDMFIARYDLPEF